MLQLKTRVIYEFLELDFFFLRSSWLRSLKMEIGVLVQDHSHLKFE